MTLLSVPIFHVAGVTPIMSSVWGGRTLVILPQFDPELWLKAVEKRARDAQLRRADDAEADHGAPGLRTSTTCRSLKLITYGAAPMPYEVVSKAVDVFNCGLMNAYGQTESTSTMTFLGPDDHNIPHEPGPERDKKLHRLRSVGRGMDDVEIAIMDDDGKILEAGTRGRDLREGPAHHVASTTSRRRRRRPRSTTAGCTPATSATWTRTATCSSPAARRT